jgi:hypothetical protein
MLNAIPVIPFALMAFCCALISSISFAVAAVQDENVSLNAAVENITLVADDDTITRVARQSVASGSIEYKTMTFYGTVPGPTLRLNAVN